MRPARLLAVLAATLVCAAPAAGTTRTAPLAPDQLHAFLLRAAEPLTHTFVGPPAAKNATPTPTTAADAPDCYASHRRAAGPGLVPGRAGAVRTLYGSARGLPNGLPAVPYGPGSKTYPPANPPITSGPIRLT